MRLVDFSPSSRLGSGLLACACLLLVFFGIPCDCVDFSPSLRLDCGLLACACFFNPVTVCMYRRRKMDLTH